MGVFVTIPRRQDAVNDVSLISKEDAAGAVVFWWRGGVKLAVVVSP